MSAIPSNPDAGSHPPPLLIVNKLCPVMHTAPKIHRQELMKLMAANDPDLVIINCVEAYEPLAKAPTVPNSVNIPMGEIFHKALSDPAWKAANINKKLVVWCTVGYRASIVAQELSQLGYNIRYLDGGQLGFVKPAASTFDYVVVYGKPAFEVDKLSEALSQAIAAQRSGCNTALMLSGEGVLVGAKEGGLKGDEAAGEPFQPVKDLLKSFLEEGGLVFACPPCLAAHKLDYPLMQSWVNKATRGDLIRWTRSASAGHLEFF